MDFSVSNGNVHYLVVVVLITIIFKYVLSRWQLYVVSWKLPGPLALPLIGNALQLPISSKGKNKIKLVKIFIKNTIL